MCLYSTFILKRMSEYCNSLKAEKTGIILYSYCLFIYGHFLESERLVELDLLLEYTL